MNFEKNLRNRLLSEVLKKIEKDFHRILTEGVILKEDLQGIKFDSIKNAYSIYLENNMKDISKEQLYKLFDEFEEVISPKVLMEKKRKIQLDDQEKIYIKYKKQCNWREYKWNRSYL